MRKQISFALALSMVMTSGIATVANAAADDGKRTWYFGTAGLAAMAKHLRHL